MESKKFNELKTEQVEKAADMMKAIAHPLRLSILGHLSNEGKSYTVTEIHELLHIEQSTASHHLGLLKDKGVLVSRREGKNTIYSLKSENIVLLMDCIANCACI